jgi:capsular polysaccharide transport system ATP-binding protein
MPGHIRRSRHQRRRQSTLIRLLAGSEMPDRGRIRRHARVSFPLGFGGTFHGTLSGRENVAFIARVYGAGVRHTTRYVEDFAELGGYFDMPVNTYSAGMRARLAFGACLAVDFDIYLIDEVTEIGDDRFRHKCRCGVPRPHAALRHHFGDA